MAQLTATFAVAAEMFTVLRHENEFGERILSSNGWERIENKEYLLSLLRCSNGDFSLSEWVSSLSHILYNRKSRLKSLISNESVNLLYFRGELACSHLSGP